ncbi:MAG: hypothetical protein Kow0069_27110 [Promethearchaeota archaeon]
MVVELLLGGTWEPVALGGPRPVNFTPGSASGKFRVTSTAELASFPRVEGVDGVKGAAELRVRREVLATSSARVKCSRERWWLPSDFRPASWCPTLAPGRRHVVGEHVLGFPLLAVRTSRCLVALLARVDLDQRPTSDASRFVRVRVAGDGATLEHGFARVRPAGHTFFEIPRRRSLHVPRGARWLQSHDLLLLPGDALPDPPSVLPALRVLSALAWDRLARPRLRRALASATPLRFQEHARRAYSTAFGPHAAWVDWEVRRRDGAWSCGGTCHRSWLGRRKGAWSFHSGRTGAQRVERAIRESRRETNVLRVLLHGPSSRLLRKRWFVWMIDRVASSGLLPRRAQVWHGPWFCNVRSAYGLLHWSLPDRLDVPAWRRRAEAIVRGLVFSPETPLGLLPAVALPDGKGRADWVEGTKAFELTRRNDLASVATSAYWLLKVRRDFGNAPRAWPGLLQRVDRVVASLLRLQDGDGSFPAWAGVEGGRLVVDGALRREASCGSVLMLLGEYLATFPRGENGSGVNHPGPNRGEVIDAAGRLADFLERAVLRPGHAWRDFEPYFSCSSLPLDFRDEASGDHVRNALCVHWTAEGFKGLFEATGERRYLEAGLRALDVLSTFQQVWSPPFLSADLFGGFGAQNADAEWSDARGALFAPTFAEYYVHVRDPRLMERAVAALRASFALSFVPELRGASPGNLRDLGRLVGPNGADGGLIPENYGHFGLDEPVTGFVNFDWGTFSALTAAAYFQRHFGDVFVDCETGFAMDLERRWGPSG